MSVPFLESSELYLRPLVPEDADGPYVTWFNDKEVCRGNAHHKFPYTLQAALEYIESAQNFAKAFVLAIIEKENQSHIGNISLQKIDPISRSAEFAIVIGDKQSWGKGYSKQAGRLILDHAFFTLNLNRVYCGTFENNLPMQKLASYLGMTEEGRRRKAAFKDNRYLDILEYGVLREEYIEKLGENQ